MSTILKDLLTTYWSQMTLLLLAVGYFVKRIFDNKSKKIEINHSLLQQNRISSLNKFFANYTIVELLWNQIELFNILSKKIEPKEIDAIVFPPINDLKKSLLEMKILFNRNDFSQFEIITDNIISINQKLSQLYFDINCEQNINSKSCDFEIYKMKILKSNKVLLEGVCSRIRKSFGA